MISYVEGNISEVDIDYLVVDVNGIGYEVYVPASLITKLPKSRECIRFYTHHNIREDEQTLYGFLTKRERDMFRDLKSVSGIGPKVALAMLSHLSVEQIIEAVIRADDKLIATTPGVGKKTASRMILELKGKFGSIEIQSVAASVGQGGVTVEPSITEDARSALMALGYNARDIGNAMSSISAEEMQTITTAEDCIKIILKRL